MKQAPLGNGKRVGPTNKTTRITSITIPLDLYPKAVRAAKADRRPLSPWIVLQIERGIREHEEANVNRILARSGK